MDAALKDQYEDFRQIDQDLRLMETMIGNSQLTDIVDIIENYSNNVQMFKMTHYKCMFDNMPPRDFVAGINYIEMRLNELKSIAEKKYSM